MKTFSDRMGTDLDVEVKIGVSAISDNGSPWCGISVNNNSLWSGVLRSSVTVTATAPLLEAICIQVEMRDKSYHDRQETAVVIDLLEIDQIDVSNHVAGLVSYRNDQMVQNQSLYLGFNGIWTLDIPGPFYRWWHAASGQGWLLQPLKAKSHDCFPS